MLRLDGLQGFLVAAAKMGALLQRQPVGVDSGWLWPAAVSDFGEEEALAAVREAAAQDANLALYLAKVAKEPESSDRLCIQGLTEVRFSQLVAWGRDARSEDLVSAANGLLRVTAGDWSAEAKTARRKAAEMAVAMDGLADRVHQELNFPLDTIRAEVATLCLWPKSNLSREEAFERVHGVANAYKHSELKKPSHVLHSFDDVLAVGLGFGLDGFGVGKFSGVEVLIKDKQARSWKFMGDVPVVLNGWCSFLTRNDAALPKTPCRVCGVDMSIGH